MASFEGPSRPDAWTELRARAEDALKHHGSLLTPLRECILKELQSASGPIGAYDLAERIGRFGKRRPVAANTIYRILATFVDAGVVRRLQSRHAFTVIQPGEADTALVLLCDDCGGSTAVNDTRLDARLLESAREQGFEPTSRIVELAGRCRACIAPGASA